MIAINPRMSTRQIKRELVPRNLTLIGRISPDLALYNVTNT